MTSAAMILPAGMPKCAHWQNDMFDTIILLASDIEEPVFATLLQSFNPALSILLIVTAAELAALSHDLLQRARLIGFATPVIVPGAILDQLGFGAYNFHPGPPSYPGWAPAIFAVFDDAREFGVTAHRMSERVDEGEIVGASLFAVPQGSSVADLEALSYAALIALFRQFASSLATEVEPLTALPIAWSGKKCTRRAFAAIFNLPLEIAPNDFQAAVTAEAISRLNCTAVDFGHLPSVASPGVWNGDSPPIAPDEADPWYGDQARVSLGHG
jgi:methionyl-tRNA formyltransferase